MTLTVELAAMRRTHQSRVSAIKGQHQDDLEKLERELKEAGRAHRQTIQSEEEHSLRELQSEVQAAREECDREIQALRLELRQAKDRNEVELASIEQESFQQSARHFVLYFLLMIRFKESPSY